MSVNPWAIVGGSLIQGGLGLFGSNKAADAQEEAAKRALREQRRTLGIGLNLIEPQRYLGYQAQDDLAHLYGYGMAPFVTASELQEPTLDASAIIAALNRGSTFDEVNSLGRLGELNEQEIAKLRGAGLTPEQIKQLSALPGASGGTGGAGGGYGTGGDPSLSRFWASPDYQFRRDEGTRGIQQSAAASGQGIFSGDTLRDLNRNNSNLASGEFGNYFARLATLAGYGTQATQQAGSAVQNAGANMSDLYARQGDARASGILGGTNSLGNAIGDGLGLWAFLQGMKK